ncbi:hypothetical protein VQH23_17495 [Pararoseomonas sp. SCSIO 73927]|uniref:hypothetical protein n=1 Tax=Pararoseomonas sp. SCSIO 73927 TaxID=3114537 RepID=UPI0030CD5D8B
MPALSPGPRPGPRHGRRGLLAAFALLPGCAPLLPPLAGGTAPEAKALLDANAEAHGLPALRRVNDVNVSYDGEWAPLIGRIQPALVDSGHRGPSQERLLPGHRLLAQNFTGSAGRKAVLRRWAANAPGTVRVRFEDRDATEEDRRAAALVADGYALFLLGPMLLAGPWAADRAPLLAPGGEERITVSGRARDCDILRARIAPGLGFSPAEELALYIGRADRLMHRVRFGLEGLESTRGAVAEVDLWDHMERGGIRWPTRFHERLLRPFPLAVHDWHLTGLDLDRGLTPADLEGETLSPRAAAPAGAPLG